jgi:hypothetical protein
MGLYRIQLKQQATSGIHATMASIGLPVVRIEQRDDGTYYFYEDPKTKKEHAFWTCIAGEGIFWCSGLSSSARQIAERFTAAGLFTKDEREL